MQNEESPTVGLHGSYRDVLHDDAGRVTWDSGWKKNTIVVGCRHLIASLMKGQAGALGIQGIYLGAGAASWDAEAFPGLPPITTADAALVDLFPYYLAPVQINFVDPATNLTTSNTTNILQIVATLGAGVPNWPQDGHHVDGTLREFGLVGQINGVNALLNEVRHVAIPKDPTSTLVRTVQLVF